MKKFFKNPTVATFAISFALVLTGPIAALAATAPTLGSSSTYGVVSSTYTGNVAATNITGDVCYTTGPGTFAPVITGGALVVPCADARGTEQTAALSTLNSQSCTSLGAAVALSGTYTPGCYSSTGAMDIAADTTITLNGAGVYIFRPGGALTTGANSSISLTGGASASDVFWAPIEATTIGAYTTGGIPPAAATFVGTILDAAGITIGHFANLSGRALAFGGTVTTDANTITVPSSSSLATLHVVKTVDNTGGGTASASDFTLHVKLSGVEVSGSSAVGVASPGRAYSLAAGTYVVSEDTNDSYTQSFSGSCPGGSITLSANQDATCTITNTYIPPATLRVIKHVVNGSWGGANANAWTLSVTSSNGGTGTGSAVGIESGTTYTLQANKQFSVAESGGGPSGYTASFSGDCTIASAVSNGTYTCTVTNNYTAAAPINNISGSGGGSFAPLPLINVTKIPSPLDLPKGPGPVTYTYTATNIGPIGMIGVWVKDDKCEPVQFISGDSNSNSMLDAGESWIYRCTKTVSKTETNTATAHGSAGGLDVYDTASATVVVGAAVTPPLIHLLKKPNVFVLPAGGGAVTYSYTVTNPGTAPLHDVIITDDKCTGLPGRVVGHPGDLNKNDLLESSESWSFTCQTNLTKTTTNTGTAKGSANGFTAIDYSPATVVVASSTAATETAPKLPGTGIGPREKYASWNLALVLGFMLVLAQLGAIEKKRAI